MRKEIMAMMMSVVMGSFMLNDLDAGERVVLDITEFGAMPDSGKDACGAVKAALARAKQAGQPVTIRFPKGRYDFFKEAATKVHHPITSVHQQWDHFTPFYADGMQDITIDGDGSLFMMHGRMTPMIWYRCERIRIVDLSIDQRYPSVQEAKVEAHGDGAVDWRIHPDTRYILGDNGKPIWLDADGEISEQPNIWKGFNADENTYRAAGGNVFEVADKVEELKPGLLRCHMENSQRYKIGHSLQWRWHIRNQQGMIILESRDVKLKRVELHTTNGLGILAQLSHDISLEQVYVEPRAESGRTAASFADCMQAAACTGTIRVENCRFNRAQDDAINIFSFMLLVEKVESPRSALLTWPCAEQCGFNLFFPGDVIGYRGLEDLLIKGTNTVVSSELLDINTLRVTFSEDLPPDTSAIAVENLSRIPDNVIIRNNYVGGMTTRGMLINTGRKMLIEGNTFDRISSSALLAKTPDGHYWLQNHIDGLVIRDNAFIECTGTEDVRFTPGTGIIFLNLQTQTVVPGEYAYRDVVVEGNRFVNKHVGAAAVKVRGVKGLAIRDNTFETTGASPHLATVFGCADVKLSGNTIDSADGKGTVFYGQMESGEIRITSETQWVLEKHGTDTGRH